MQEFGIYLLETIYSRLVFSDFEWDSSAPSLYLAFPVWLIFLHSVQVGFILTQP